MKLTTESKLFISILAITGLVIGLSAFIFTKPAPTYSKEDLMKSDTYAKGAPNAKVILVEFSDFQCPACGAVKPTVDAVLAKHKDSMIFAYRHFPLDQHPFAQKAALAAEAAGIQGKFWEMYDLLFANQEKFSDTIFKDLAKQLSLDETKFDSDMKSSSLENRIQRDIQDGLRFDINATPTFFLNGKKLELSTFDDLSKAVDEAINNNK